MINVFNMLFLFLLCFLPLKSFSSKIRLAGKYQLKIDHNKFASIDVTNNKHTLIFCSDSTTNEQLIVNTDLYNNLTTTTYGNIYTNLIQKNFIPCEWELANISTSLNLNFNKNNLFTININFISSPFQESASYKFNDISFNLYFCNIGVNSLIFSKEKNITLISTNQIKICDYETYKENREISKVTIMAIPNHYSKASYSNKDKKTENSDYSNKSLSISPSVINTTDNAKNWLPISKHKSIKNKVFETVKEFRDDNDMVAILNKYCNINATEYSFFLSPKFIKFLNKIKNLTYGKKNKSHDPILIVNPYFPIFFYNEQQKPQIMLTNVYALLFHCENINDNYIFHFYTIDEYYKFSFLGQEPEDFITIATDHKGVIFCVNICEQGHVIAFEIDRI